MKVRSYKMNKKIIFYAGCVIALILPLIKSVHAFASGISLLMGIILASFSLILIPKNLGKIRKFTLNSAVVFFGFGLSISKVVAVGSKGIFQTAISLVVVISIGLFLAKIFKMEKKDTFLKVLAQDENFQVNKDFGFNLSKIDKGCMIYNIQKEEGFVVKAFDNNKNGDSEYWFDKFLHIRQRNDEYFSTESTLSLYKNYITNQLPQEFEVSKADQADFLNKTINFFKEKERFDFDEFTNEVLQDKNVIESFSNYKTEYEQEFQVDIAEEFPISEAAVKKQARNYKSVIKLDKNFHIYVHGDRRKIEQGEDEKGKFYKVYYQEEN